MEWSVRFVLAVTFALAIACAKADFPEGCSPTLDLDPKFPGATGTVQIVNGELRIGYDFSGGGHYVAARFDRMPGPPVVRELSFLSDCPSGAHLMLQLVDATGQTFQKWFPGHTEGFEHFTCRLERFAGYWGGAADGVFHQPLTGIAVLAHADEPGGCVGPRGTLRFRLLGLYPEEANVRFAQRRPDVPFGELVREVGSLRDELTSTLAELEPQGRGAKTRATIAVLNDFLPWILEDVVRGYTNRAVRAAWELVDVARKEKERLRRVRTGEEWDPPVPHFVTGPVETSHAQLIGTREWPDGRRERGNVILTGFGHFGRVQRELAKLPPLGNHILQMEIGPRMVLPQEGMINTNALDVFFETAKRAACENVQICLLMSPHYFPDWALAKWPHLKDCSSDGFFKYCVYDENARTIIERTLRTVIPLVRGNPALHSICLSNEPECGVFGRCPMIMREWPKYLLRRFGTVGAMNAALGTSLASFEAAPVPAEHPKTPASPLVAEFVRFNRQVFADFHRWMAGIVRELAPEIPVHAKIMIDSSFGDTVTYQSVDPEAFSEMSDYSGNDAYDCPLVGNPFGWAHTWWAMEAGYDYQRSVRDIPIFNSENHIIRDRNVPTLGGRHVYTALWQNAVHGQAATTAWLWERAFDDGKSDANGLFLDRPAWLAAWARCAIDMNRLADTLAPIQNLSPTVLLHFSLTTQLREGRRGKRFLKWYRAANILGQPLGVATEKALAEYGRGGPRVRPLDACRVLLMPDDRFLPAEVKKGVECLAADGVRIVRSDEDRDERDLAMLFEKQAKDWHLPDLPRAVDPVTGTGVFGVESRGYRQDGKSYVTLVNHQDRVRRVRLEASGVDLITGRRLPEVIDLDPLVPLFIEMPTCRQPMEDILVNKPDYVVYVPTLPIAVQHRKLPYVEARRRGDSYNDHFQVLDDAQRGFLYAFWTQASWEGCSDQHIAFSKSLDKGRSWTKPIVLAGSECRAFPKLRASWQQPMLSKSGRLYCLWNQQTTSRKPHFGQMFGAFSDDAGETWSEPKQVPFPCRMDQDDPDPTVPPCWCNWQRPLRIGEGGRYFVGCSRHGKAPYDEKACCKIEFWQFENIDDDPKVEDILFSQFATNRDSLSSDKVEPIPGVRYFVPTLNPEGKPEDPAVEEASLVRLPDGRLFAMMRSSLGCPVWSQSRDGGRSWSGPKAVLDAKGKPFPHPRSPCPLYDWKGPESGSGYYFGLVHMTFDSNKSTAYQARGPLYLIAGRFDPTGSQPVRFLEPKLFAPRKWSNSFYSSYTVVDGEGVLWFNDRKYYLLGRKIGPEWFQGDALDGSKTRR